MTEWGIDTLFNPSKRHMDEEKRRLQSTREEVGDSSGGRRIDLESGKVVIRRQATVATTPDEDLVSPDDERPIADEPTPLPDERETDPDDNRLVPDEERVVPVDEPDTT